VNTAAVENPLLVTEGAKYFGSQCIVVAIDARRSHPWDPASPRWEVTTYGGRKLSHLEAVSWAKEVADRGAGEILLTSMDRDGTELGYDNELNRRVAESVGIPIIASGGCGAVHHIAAALTEGKASAALAASIFHYGRHSIAETKAFLRALGIPVRLA
jgi:cyclase